MKIQSTIALFLAGVTLLSYTASHANEMFEKAPTELLVEFGTSDGELVIIPRELRLMAGENYKLVIRNPSSVNHTVSARDFGETVQPSVVDTFGAEVIAARVGPRMNTPLDRRPVASYLVKEIEIQPGGTAEWFFTPAIPGTYKLDCAIHSHQESGMTSRIVVNE